MTRDPARVDKELARLVREQSKRAGRPAEEAEVRAALAPLSPAEEQVLRGLLAQTPPARPLGPFAWADLARGIAPQIAAAREMGGYYALAAERDALAAMVSVGPLAAGKPAPAPAAKAAPAVETAPPQKPRGAPKGKRVSEASPRTQATPRNDETRKARIEHVLGLFAYHRDGPRVARALGLATEDLDLELDALKIRRKAYRLTRGSDLDLPLAASIAGAPTSTPVRRRAKNAKLPLEPLPEEATPGPRETQAGELKALLVEVGPRRARLAERLGLSETAVLARFRKAGLEREFALRERDLLRALWTRHRASEARVAKELGTTPAALREIALDRGLARELDRALDAFRHDLRKKRWPRERIHVVLHQRDELRDLGLLEELEKEVVTRVRVLWAELKKKKPRPLEDLRLALGLTDEDAGMLQRLVDLR